ncbi:MAG: sialidase family protein [Anaerolineae bacterium]|nr:sialidase family protein [Anaerolineae bacterium]
MTDDIAFTKDKRRWPIVGIALFCVWILFLLSLFMPTRSVGQAQDIPPRSWTKIGDNRLALWRFSPNYDEDGLIFVGTAASEKQSIRGIYRSTDQGESWVDSSAGLDPKKRHYYTAFEFSPSFLEDQTIWLFGHKTGLGRTEAFGGFWESTDGAGTWTEIDYQGFPLRELAQRVSQDIIGVVISPNIAEDGTMIAAAGGEGVYISKDKGRNWELLNPIKDVFSIFVPPTYPDESFIALATTGSQVMISTDGGENFKTSGEGLPENMNAVRGIWFSDNFANDRKMFCFGAPGVFVSENAGQSWQPMALADELGTVNAMDISGDFVEYGSIVYGTDDAKVYLSDDMGQTFESLGAESLLSYGIATVAFPPDYQISRQVFVSSQDGMFRYGPAKDAAAEATAQAQVVQVEATRVARATAVAGMEFVAEESDRVETGCIAYFMLPVVLLVWYLLHNK